MTIYIGLDVHSKWTYYAAQSSSGALIAGGRVPTSRQGLLGLLESLCAEPGTAVALESGTQAFWASRLLVEAGMEPLVVSAREVRAKARRRAQKSDSRDAFELCDGLRRGIWCSIVHLPCAQVERLRRVLSRRRFFVRGCVRNANAARYLLRGAGLRGEPAGALGSRPGWRRLLSRQDIGPLREHLLLHARAWLLSRRKVERLEAELSAALEPFAREAELLQTVPGVGPITAASFIAAIARPDRFADAGRVASHLGLVPSSYDSGGRRRHGHITRSGPAAVRAVLCEAAHQAARAAHPLNPYWRRICSRGGYRKAVVAVAQRLARILWALWRRGEPFDVGRLNLELHPHAVRRTYIYRLKRPA